MKLRKLGMIEPLSSMDEDIGMMRDWELEFLGHNAANWPSPLRNGPVEIRVLR